MRLILAQKLLILILTIWFVVVAQQFPNFNYIDANLILNLLLSYSQLRVVFDNQWVSNNTQGSSGAVNTKVLISGGQTPVLNISTDITVLILDKNMKKN